MDKKFVQSSWQWIPFHKNNKTRILVIRLNLYLMIQVGFRSAVLLFLQTFLPDQSPDDENVKNEHSGKRNQMNIQHVENTVVAVKLECCSTWRSLSYNPNT